MGGKIFSKSIRRYKSATLIEVLISLAIISIIALAASSNFQQAVAMTKTAKVYSDHRTMFGALEMRAIDHGGYPATMPGISDMELNSLTTPVAYMSSLPNDPFGSKTATGVESPDQAYDYLRFLQLNEPYDILLIEYWFQTSGRAKIGLISTGPNGKQELNYHPPGILNYRLAFTEYDPTNGTISAGDIYTTNTGKPQ